MSARHVVMALLVAGVLAAGASSCSLYYALNSDPAGLPCDADDTCLAGYVCVNKVCLTARTKDVDAPCTQTAECRDGLFCGDAYAGCTDDINCALAPTAAADLRCRPVCSPSDPSVCPAGTRCFSVVDPAVQGFCQTGTCEADSDCEKVQPGALCGGRVAAGKTGFCFQSCDPLSCFHGACTGCTGTDGVDDGKNCLPIPGEALTARLGCDLAGHTPAFAACGVDGADLCTIGTFCLAFNGGQFCAPWCRFPGGSGAPECDVGTACQQVQGELGFCSP